MTPCLHPFLNSHRCGSGIKLELDFRILKEMTRVRQLSPCFLCNEIMLHAFVPSFFETNNVSKCLVHIVPEFVRGMRRNNDTFSVRGTGDWRRDLLRRLQFCDIKKLHISSETGRLTFRKTMTDLLPYDEDFEEVALRVSHENGVKKSSDGKADCICFCFSCNYYKPYFHICFCRTNPGNEWGRQTWVVWSRDSMVQGCTLSSFRPLYE